MSIAFVDGEETARTTLPTASGAQQLVVEPDRTEIAADDADLAYVAITIADPFGIVYPGADRPITVEIQGPAVVQGLASADPRSEESFRSTTCRTYNGRALAVIRPTGPGTIDLEITADDMAPASCRLIVSEG